MSEETEASPKTRLDVDPKTGLAVDNSAPHSPVPAQGGWVPPVWLPMLVIVLGGALTSALAIVQGPWAIVIQVALGVLTSVAAALGIQSAGPRKL